MKIDELEFSTRTYNCLKRARIDTVEQLLTKSDAELMKIRCFGTGCLAEVHEKIRKPAGVTIIPAVPGPSEDASNNKDMYFKCGMRHMKTMVLAMLQDVLDQAGGFCMIDVGGVIKAVEDL